MKLIKPDKRRKIPVEKKIGGSNPVKKLGGDDHYESVGKIGFWEKELNQKVGKDKSYRHIIKTHCKKFSLCFLSSCNSNVPMGEIVCYDVRKDCERNCEGGISDFGCDYSSYNSVSCGGHGLIIAKKILLTFYRKRYNNKVVKRNLFFTILLIFFISHPASSYASFPSVTGGPGLILSDSPFYVLDKLYQKGKLLLAQTPARRAEVRNNIMGERMAEIKIAYDRGDRTAMGLALLELSEEARKIEADLKEARASGADVPAIAKTTSDSLRFYRKVLSEASLSSDYDVSLALESARESLFASKTVIEDFLREEDLANALRDDIDDEGQTAVLGVQARTERLEKILGAFEQKTNREAVLGEQRLSPEGNNAAERALREKRRQLLQRRRDLLEKRKKKLSETREALKRAREAARGFVETRQEERNLQTAE